LRANVRLIGVLCTAAWFSSFLILVASVFRWSVRLPIWFSIEVYTPVVGRLQRGRRCRQRALRECAERCVHLFVGLLELRGGLARPAVAERVRRGEGRRPLRLGVAH
jgi:hypothetical protein